jgi:hypothetical protein
MADYRTDQNRFMDDLERQKALREHDAHERADERARSIAKIIELAATVGIPREKIEKAIPTDPDAE